MEKKTEKRRTRAYVEKVYSLIEEKPDIVDIMILNAKGNPIKTSMPKNTSIQYAGLYEILRNKVVLGLQKIDPTDELLMLRVRTLKHETFIVPDDKITVMVLQQPKDCFGI